MITRDELLAIGRYNKPHGVNGELSVTLDCDPELLDGFSCLVSDIDGIFVPFFVGGWRPKGATTALLSIDGIASEHDAALLVGKEVFVLKREYDKLALEEGDDALPVDYFIGWEALNGTELLGHVARVDDSTANVLFVIERPDGSELMVPAVEEFVVEVDSPGKRLVMQLPQELLQLNG